MGEEGLGTAGHASESNIALRTGCASIPTALPPQPALRGAPLVAGPVGFVQPVHALVAHHEGVQAIAW